MRKKDVRKTRLTSAKLIKVVELKVDQVGCGWTKVVVVVDTVAAVVVQATILLVNSSVGVF